MTEQLPMPTRGPVYASGDMHLVQPKGDRGRIEEWCGNVYQTENDTVRYRGSVCSIQSATCIGGIGPREAEANSALIAAAFNAAEKCRKMGLDPIAVVQALPQLANAVSLFFAWLDAEDIGPNYGSMTRDTHPDGEAIWREWWNRNLKLCGESKEAGRTALSAARTRSQP